MKKRKMKWVITGLLCMLMSTTVFADSYNMDGDFSDWNNVQAVDTSGISYFFDKISTSMDDDYFYIYAVEKSTNSWENYYSYANPILVDESGKEYPLVILDGCKLYGNTQDLIVKNQNGWTDIQGAEGIRTKKHTYEWELKIPTKEVGKIKECKLKIDYSHYVSFIPTKAGQGENETTMEEETTKEEATVKPSTSGIVIDGTYADWKDYPHAYVTNWNMPDSMRNENNCRQLSLVHDDKYLYFHVKMIGGWFDPFNGNEYHITAGGKTISINLRTESNGQLP